MRAGTYRETVTPNSGVTIAAYNFENVVVDGSDPVTGWTPYQGVIYQAKVAMRSDDTNQIFVGSDMMTEARWPNGDDLFHVKWATARSGTNSERIVDSSLPSYMLSHWARDRHRGPGLPLPQLVKMQTSETADFFGFRDRGRLKPGLRADLNLIDFARLRLHQPEIVHDLPAGGRRLVQRADGYRATLVAGAPTFENGEATGARPGRLVRAHA